MAALADPLSVMATRSPGARAAGALTQTKLRKAAAPGDRTFATALTRPVDRLTTPVGDVGTPGTAAIVGEPVVAAPDTGFPIADAVADAPVAGVGGFAPSAPGIVVAPVGGGGSTGGNTGGGGGGGGGTSVTPPVTTPTPTPTPTTLPPTVSAVPEPGTWLTLMLGFGAVGGALRARRRQAGSAIARVARG